MRFAPAAAALSLVFAVTASVTSADDYKPEPRAAALVMQGQALLKADDPQGAIDAFEAALAVDPGYTEVFLQLANVARFEGLQGKAIRYYRETLVRDPKNLAAISGEGEALVEKGAFEKARLNLAQLRSLCGANCPETQALQTTIAVGARARLAAETGDPESSVAQN